MNPFRDEFIAASLKLALPALSRVKPLPFRDEFIAASLKLDDWAQRAATGLNFPR